MYPRVQAPRPMRDFLNALPLLPVTPDGVPCYMNADKALLDSIAENAETTMNVVQAGLGAIGALLAHSAVAIESGDISAQSLESLGWLQAEISDLMVSAMFTASTCRAALANKAGRNRARQR